MSQKNNGVIYVIRYSYISEGNFEFNVIMNQANLYKKVSYRKIYLINNCKFLNK